MLNVQELQRCVKKIDRMHAVRCKILERRRQTILELITEDGELRFLGTPVGLRRYLDRNPHIIKTLADCIDREKRLLDLIRKKDHEAENTLTIAIREMKNNHFAILALEKDLAFRRALKRYNIRPRDFIRMTYHALGFLEKVDDTFKLIEERLRREWRFVLFRSMGRFESFLEAWRIEEEYNWELEQEIAHAFEHEASTLSGEELERAAAAIAKNALVVGGSYPDAPLFQKAFLAGCVVAHSQRELRALYRHYVQSGRFVRLAKKLSKIRRPGLLKRTLQFWRRPESR